MGDAVNLAARLMQAAKPGQILAGDSTYRPTGHRFDWEPLAPMQVKGKSEPVGVQALRAAAERVGVRLSEPAYALPMVGRVRELRRAREAIERAAQGHGQIIGITAEAGMGKSRLNAAIVQLAVERGFAAYAGAGQSYGANTSYLAWHMIWRDFFHLAASGLPEALARQLEAQLAAIDSRLAQRAPLLGVALNIPIPDNELTRSLDAQLRTELLRSLLLDCLRARVAPSSPGMTKPLVLVLEDCHWLDPLSQELLEFVGRNLAELPILLIALYRPPEQAHGPLDWAARFGHFTEIRLTELEPAQAEQLMRLKLAHLTGRAGEVPAELIERIAERAQGNPFYVEEMINYIHDRGVDLRDERALQALELPDSLRSLILSRIDRLAENEQITLKVASIVGRQFRAGWLWGSYPELGAPAEVRWRLDRLSRLDLTPLDRPEPVLEYLF
jgi:predicted ATPase